MSARIVKCDYCEFKSASRKGVNIHKGSKHKNLNAATPSPATTVSTSSQLLANSCITNNISLNPPLPCRNRQDGCTSVVDDYFDKFIVICKSCITSMKNQQKNCPFTALLWPACNQQSGDGNFSLCALCLERIQEDGFIESNWGA